MEIRKLNNGVRDLFCWKPFNLAPLLHALSQSNMDVWQAIDYYCQMIKLCRMLYLNVYDTMHLYYMYLDFQTQWLRVNNRVQTNTEKIIVLTINWQMSSQFCYCHIKYNWMCFKFGTWNVVWFLLHDVNGQQICVTFKYSDYNSPISR